MKSVTGILTGKTQLGFESLACKFKLVIDPMAFVFQLRFEKMLAGSSDLIGTDGSETASLSRLINSIRSNVVVQESFYDTGKAPKDFSRT